MDSKNKIEIPNEMRRTIQFNFRAFKSICRVVSERFFGKKEPIFNHVKSKYIEPRTLKNLETHFNDYCNYRISVDVYIAKIKLEIADIKQRSHVIDHIKGSFPFLGSTQEKHLKQYSQTLKAAQWCLDWAEQRRQDAFSQDRSDALAHWREAIDRDAQPV